MLGKLLKYELKSTSRLMGVLYLAVLIVAAIVGFLARGTIWQATQGNAIAVVVSGLIYTLLIMTLMIVTVVMILSKTQIRELMVLDATSIHVGTGRVCIR